MCTLHCRIILQSTRSDSTLLHQEHLYRPMPQTMDEMERKAEEVYDSLNGPTRRAMVVRSVLTMRKRARKCIQADGRHFEGRKLP